MSTAIEWTDQVWNPVTGCTKVSAGCKHCYAETIANRRLPQGGFTDRPFTEVRCHPERLDAPLHWRKPRRVFVNSMSDLFHEDVPDEFIVKVFSRMQRAERHTFQVLTKRAERMADVVERIMRPEPPLPNVWLGVSVENREQVSRITTLRTTPAALRFISFEPLLEDLGDLLLSGISWGIIGGESGPKARPCDAQWVRRVMGQCRRWGAAPFVKQMGANVRDRNDRGFDGDLDIYVDGGGWVNPDAWPHTVEVEDDPDGYSTNYQGAPVRIHLRNRKGGDMSEWPADLRVREFPA